jgi:hypothetical protein
MAVRSFQLFEFTTAELAGLAVFFLAGLVQLLAQALHLLLEAGDHLVSFLTTWTGRSNADHRELLEA